MSILKSVVKITESKQEEDLNLTYEDCINICVTAIKESTKIKALMNIAIVDRAGNLAFFYKMPSAWEGSVDIAKSKAYTAVAFSGDKDKQGPLTTAKLGDLSQPGQPLFGIQNTNRDKDVVTFGGGVPLYKSGNLIGALGISGSTVDDDVQIANLSSKGYQ